jgi:hypothetical protein
MALTELVIAQCKLELSGFLERRRPPPHIRGKLDLAYRISGQSVETLEVRPRFSAPAEKYEAQVAKATYVRTRDVGRMFWKRRDLKWHRYGPKPEAKTFGEFLGLVDRDEYGCFFG